MGVFLSIDLTIEGRFSLRKDSLSLRKLPALREDVHASRHQDQSREGGARVPATVEEKSAKCSRGIDPIQPERKTILREPKV